MHQVERARRWKHFWSPRLDESRDAAVGDGHGVGQAEAAFDPVDVVAEEPVEGLERDSSTLVRQDLENFLLESLGKATRIVLKLFVRVY